MKYRRLAAGIVLVCALLILFAGCKQEGRTLQVSFDLNYDNAPEGPSAIQVYADGTYGELPTPSEEREGFTFDGWYLNKSFKGDPVTPETVVTSYADHTLYAKWAGDSLTVSFDLQGGNINGITTVDNAVVTCGDRYGIMAIPNDPAREGYRFRGWFYDADGLEGPITDSTYVTKTTDHTIYAVWRPVRSEFDFEEASQIEDFTTAGYNIGMSIVEDTNNVFNMGANNHMLELSATGEKGAGNRYRLLLSTPIEAGTWVSLNISFGGEIPIEEMLMSVGCYGAGAGGDPISTGSLEMNSDAVRRWYWGNGMHANYKDGKFYYGQDIWKEATSGYLEFQVMEDCAGICFLLGFGTNDLTLEQLMETRIYLDNIKLSDTGTPSVPYGSNTGTAGSTEIARVVQLGDYEVCQFKGGASLSADTLDGQNVVKVQNNGGNWFHVRKAGSKYLPLPAGSIVTMDVEFDRGDSDVDAIVLEWFLANKIPEATKWLGGRDVTFKEGETRKSYTITMRFDQYSDAIVMSATYKGSVSGKQAPAIYIKNINILYGDGNVISSHDPVNLGEYQFFAYESWANLFSAEVNANAAVKVERGFHANGNWFSVRSASDGGSNLIIQPGTTVTMDVVFDRGNSSASKMSLEWFVAKENYEAIKGISGYDVTFAEGETQKTATVTMRYAELSYAITMSIWYDQIAQGEDNPAIYFKNITIREASDEPVIPDGNIDLLNIHTSATSADLYDDGVSFKCFYLEADANIAPVTGWTNDFYIPSSAACVKVVRDGRVLEVGTGAGVLLKLTENTYFFAEEANRLSTKIKDGDVLILEGEFNRTISGVAYTIYIPTTYIYLDASTKTATVSDEAPEINQAAVTFDLNYEGAPSSETVYLDFGATYGELPVVSRDGHIFEGWYKESECVNKVEITTVVSESHTLYAKWTVNTITTDDDSDYRFGNTTSDVIVTLVERDDGRIWAKAIHPGTSGQKFWYMTSAVDETGLNLKAGSVITMDVIFERGNNTNVSAMSLTYGKSHYGTGWGSNIGIDEGANAQFTSHTFAAGETSYKTRVTIEVGRDSQNLIFFFSVSGAVTVGESLPAAYIDNITIRDAATVEHCTVSFDLNGVEGAIPETQTVLCGEAYGALPTVICDGYTFEGWYKESECVNKVEITTVVLESHTLYAKWTANAVLADDDSDYRFGNTTSDVIVTLVERDDGRIWAKAIHPGTSGQKFWYMTSAVDETGLNLKAGSVITMDVILERGNNTNVSAMSLTYGKSHYGTGWGSNIGIDEGANAQFTSHTFAAGETSYKTRVTIEVGQDSQNLIFFFSVSGAVTVGESLPAAYIDNITIRDAATVEYCTVSFDLNGVEGAIPETQTVLCGEAYGALPTVICDGYTFEGWYKESECVNKVETSTVVLESHTLYAKWKSNAVLADDDSDYRFGNTSSDVEISLVESGNGRVWAKATHPGTSGQKFWYMTSAVDETGLNLKAGSVITLDVIFERGNNSNVSAMSLTYGKSHNGIGWGSNIGIDEGANAQFTSHTFAAGETSYKTRVTIAVGQDSQNLIFYFGLVGTVTEGIELPAIYVDNVQIEEPGQTPQAYDFETGIVPTSLRKSPFHPSLNLEIVSYGGSNQLKLNTTVRAEKWLLLDGAFTAGTRITMDVTVVNNTDTTQTMGVDMYQYSNTTHAPQNDSNVSFCRWEIPAGEIQTNTVSFVLDNDCETVLINPAFGDYLSNVIYLDNIAIQ